MNALFNYNWNSSGPYSAERSTAADTVKSVITGLALIYLFNGAAFM